MNLIFFILLVSIASSIAFLFPQNFMDFKSWIIPLLMLVMLTMGIHLKLDDFKRTMQNRRVVFIGVAIQFLVMPLAAWVLGKSFSLPEELLIGMVLVGATAGGTASNIITYLAKGDLALSVSMTLVSTILAVFMLPLLSWLYLGYAVEVPVLSMMKILFQVILIPLAIGMLLALVLKPSVLQKLENWTSGFAILVVVFIIAIVVALNHANIADIVWLLVFAVILHNTIGLLSGYWLTRWSGYDSVIARTVAIEVGMQNSGLSVALALKFYTPLSALPGALFSIWHNVSGMLFAYLWRMKNK